MERSIPSDTATRVRRQTISVDSGGGLKVRDLTVKQDCDGILLQWNRLNLPHRCVKLSKGVLESKFLLPIFPVFHILNIKNGRFSSKGIWDWIGSAFGQLVIGSVLPPPQSGAELKSNSTFACVFSTYLKFSD